MSRLPPNLGTELELVTAQPPSAMVDPAKGRVVIQGRLADGSHLSLHLTKEHAAGLSAALKACMQHFTKT